MIISERSSYMDLNSENHCISTEVTIKKRNPLTYPSHCGLREHVQVDILSERVNQLDHIYTPSNSQTAI